MRIYVPLLSVSLLALTLGCQTTPLSINTHQTPTIAASPIAGSPTAVPSPIAPPYQRKIEEETRESAIVLVTPSAENNSLDGMLNCQGLFGQIRTKSQKPGEFSAYMRYNRAFVESKLNIACYDVKLTLDVADDNPSVKYTATGKKPFSNKETDEIKKIVEGESGLCQAPLP